MGGRLEGRRWGPLGWLAALLAAAILNAGFLRTQAPEEIPITVEPSRLLKEQDVTLIPGGKAKINQCSWFRGVNHAEVERIFTYVLAFSTPEQQNGPSFTGRETGASDCSLHIRNLELNDTGIYTVAKTVSGGLEAGSVQIEVLDADSKPSSDPVLEPPANKGVIAGLAVGALAGAVLIGVLF